MWEITNSMLLIEMSVNQQLTAMIEMSVNHSCGVGLLPINIYQTLTIQYIINKIRKELFLKI